MNIIVIGLGSMGKRRIRLLKQIDKEIDKEISIWGIDDRKDRCKEVEELYQIKTMNSLDDALKLGADCAFVCTSPLSHNEIINRCLNNRLNVFTEINLVSDGYEENIQLAKKNNLTLFLSSTFLYRDEVKYIQNEVSKSKSILTYIYHIGQYLPDWHPWENYTDYFVGNSETSGCREIMAIDFPWIYKTFGNVKRVRTLKGKKTNLKTTYPDSYLMLLDHETGVQGIIAVDVVSRKAIRNFEVFGEDLYLTWNGSSNGLKKYNLDTKIEESIDLYQSVDRQEGYAEFVVENAYRNEIIAFFDCIIENQKSEYGFEEDKVVLGLIDEIEGD